MASHLNVAKRAADLVIGIIARVAAGQKINLDTVLDELELSDVERRALFAAIRQAVAAIGGAPVLSAKTYGSVQTVRDLAEVVARSLPSSRQKVKRSGDSAPERAVRKKLKSHANELRKHQPGKGALGRRLDVPRKGIAKFATGTVKWFNPTKGYGFIQPQDGGKEVFVHISALERAGLSTLKEGQTVQYEIVGNRDRKSAGNLKFASPMQDSGNSGARVPPTERQINIWVGDGTEELKRALKIGTTYVLNFRIGQPVAGSLTVGEAAQVKASDVPAGGLPTQWMIAAQGAELAAGTPDTEVSVAEVDGVTTWTGRFALLIPETGDSASPQLEVKPLRATPTINVLVTTTGSQVYRQFKLELVASDRPGAAPVEPTAIVEAVMPTPTAHSGLRTTHEWTTPNGALTVFVGQLMAMITGNSGNTQISSIEPWNGTPALVSGKIKNVRDAAETMRATWETHLNDIDPIDLAERLNRWSELNRTHVHGQGGPEYCWNDLGDHADAKHREQWAKMAVSKELRMLARYGQQLFLAFFPRQSNLNGWIAKLPPGARLNILLMPVAGAGFIPHVPWGLLYVADVPPEGQPIDPMGFLGLRCRIEYISHAAQASRTLGALAATHRAHFLYWGDGENDVTGKEARWQRDKWGPWQNGIFVPQSTQNPKDELLELLNDPQPTPTSVLYLFCQCGGQPNNPTLRFGSDNDPSNLIVQTDFGTAPLVDRPLVFANACTTLANDPYMASDLEEAFFARDCRAYLGTETKVPIIFGSRFAEIFFQFFYRQLDPEPIAAGEAAVQTRLFLWTHYRNIGGLFYAYVNQYDLFLASEDEVVALRTR